jgi:hypothetical protein
LDLAGIEAAGELPANEKIARSHWRDMGDPKLAF